MVYVLIFSRCRFARMLPPCLTHSSSLRLPLNKLPLQMLLQPRKLLPKPRPTPPTHKLLFQIPPPSMPPLIPLSQWEFLHINQKRRRKAIIMFPMPHTLAMPIPRQNMHVQMIHRRPRMNPRNDLGIPITTVRHGGRARLQRFLPRPLLLAAGAETSFQLFCG